MLYAELFKYTGLGTFDKRTNWENADWGGWSEPPESPAHTSFKACGTTCHDHPDCLSYTYTYDLSGHCFFISTMRLGDERTLGFGEQKAAGWDLEKMHEWLANHQCERAQWVKPSLSRIF